jgi:hypothetical protein
MSCQAAASSSILGGGILNLMHLTSVGYIPWFGSLLAECAIIGIMLTRKLAGRYPFFFAAITY